MKFSEFLNESKEGEYKIDLPINREELKDELSTCPGHSEKIKCLSKYARKMCEDYDVDYKVLFLNNDDNLPEIQFIGQKDNLIKFLIANKFAKNDKLAEKMIK
jgi:hypothetical protein